MLYSSSASQPRPTAEIRRTGPAGILNATNQMKRPATHSRNYLAALLGVAIAFVTSAQAADYTWGGGTGNWNDANWNPGPVTGPITAGNTATITNGTVTLNVDGPGNLDSITLGSGGQINMYNGDGGINAYQGLGNLILQGGIVNGGSATYHAVFNDILVPRFKEAFTLSYFQAMLVQFAFFGAYFVGSLIYFLISITTGDPIAKLGYKNGVVIGLLISAAGSAIFLPAARLSHV